MKKLVLFAAMLLVFATAAQAGIITYTWHQTSATYPGLVFTAYYRVIQGAAPHAADSNQTPPDFGGLVGLYVEGGGYPAITLTDLIPSCGNPSGCVVGGVDYEYGSPSWWVSVPDFFYVAASSAPPDYHFEWNYWATATSIDVSDDNDSSPCFQQNGCTAYGYWATNFVPEPMTVLAFLGGLLGVGLLRRRG